MRLSFIFAIVVFFSLPSLMAVNPIAWDYHGVFYYKNSQSITRDMFNYFKTIADKIAVVRAVLNPLFLIKLAQLVRDENQPAVLDELIKLAPIVENHRIRIFEILNDEMPVPGMLKLFDELNKDGIPAVLASNMYADTYAFLSQRNPEFFNKFSYKFQARELGHGKKPGTYYFKQLWDFLHANHPCEGSILFIDDSEVNIAGALKANKKWGTQFDTILFKDAAQLRNELMSRGYLVG